VILGTLEAGFFPGCAYLLSCWYPRYQLQKRNAVFFLIGILASALSGIIAYGLMQMDGLGGLAGWRWIFVVSIIELVCNLGLTLVFSLRVSLLASQELPGTYSSSTSLSLPGIRGTSSTNVKQHLLLHESKMIVGMRFQSLSAWAPTSRMHLILKFGALRGCLCS
jgi:MFS family permease